VGVKPNIPKVGDLESSGTPECLEFDKKAQNTSHWGVFGVIEKVLKLRYWKWPRIGHLDICSRSYGQKKGRKSNWQFDSRPLKVGNWPLSDLRIESAKWRWKDLNKGYNFSLDLVTIKLCNRELWAPKVPGLQLGSPGKNSHLDVASAERCREYYMGEGGGFPQVRAVVSLVVQSAPVACPNTQRCPGMWTNPRVVSFGCRFKLDLLVPLPSLIPRLLARPSTPL